MLSAGYCRACDAAFAADLCKSWQWRRNSTRQSTSADEPHVTYPCFGAPKQRHGHRKELVVDQPREYAERSHQHDTVAAAEGHAKNFIQLLFQECFLIEQQVEGEHEHQQTVAKVTCKPTSQIHGLVIKSKLGWRMQGD